jgi:SMODS and SLOG-associating 2TM effector domain 1/Protein of unknown function (DUF4231)
MDPGPDRQTATPAEVAWQRQSIWSQTANHLKADLTRWRVVALGLTIAGAVLATLAVQVATLNSPAGKVLALAGAVAVGLVPVVRGRFSSRVVQDWTRARSTSEALKSEVFMYLAGTGRYRDADRDQQLQDQVEAIQRDAGDLLLHTAGLRPLARALPTVHDVDSYVQQRVTAQIDGYYRPQAARQQQRLGRVRQAEFVLGGVGALLAAVGATWQLSSATVWVPVLTTVTAALTAHAAAARYEYLLVEYLRTAAELERLRSRRQPSAGRGGSGEESIEDEFVEACEHVISVQNEGWMAKLTSSDQPS